MGEITQWKWKEKNMKITLHSLSKKFDNIWIFPQGTRTISWTILGWWSYFYDIQFWFILQLLSKGLKMAENLKILKEIKNLKKKKIKTKKTARYSYLPSLKVVFMAIFSFQHSFPNISSHITRLNFRINFWGLAGESLTLLGDTW